MTEGETHGFALDRSATLHTRRGSHWGARATALPTAAHLDFQAAHAAARDAVHAALDVGALRADLDAAELPNLTVHSEAPDRRSYLVRPDLGRRLRERGAISSVPGAMLFVVCDGLSATAVQRHAVPLLRPDGAASSWSGSRRSSLPNRAASHWATTSASPWALLRRPADRRTARPFRRRQSRRLPHLAAAPRPHRRRTQLHLQYPSGRAAARSPPPRQAAVADRSDAAASPDPASR